MPASTGSSHRVGQSVPAGGVLLTLSNPDVEIQALQADQAYNQARFDLFAMRTNLNAARLAQEGLVATTRTNYIAATQDAAAAESLVTKNLISPFDANQKKAAAQEYETRLRVEKERLALMTSSVDSQIAVQTDQVKRLKSIAELDRSRVNALQVTRARRRHRAGPHDPARPVGHGRHDARQGRAARHAQGRHSNS